MMKYGRCDIFGGSWSIRGVFAAFIAPADGLSHLHRSATHQDTEHVSPVIPTALRVHPRRSAKLAHRDNQSSLVQPAVDEISNERSQCLIEWRDQELPANVCPVSSCGAVVVPGHAVHRHKRHACLDQQSGEQCTLAEGMAAISIAKFIGFGSDIERRDCLLAG